MSDPHAAVVRDGNTVLAGRFNRLTLVHLAKAVGDLERLRPRDARPTDDEVRAALFVHEFCAAYLRARGDVVARLAFEEVEERYREIAEERDLRDAL